MGLIVALTDHRPEPGRTRGSICSVALVMSELEPHDVEELQSWLDDQRITSDAIFLSLTNAGHQVGRQTIGRHRRGECGCSR
jgi:hypothetical protein